MGFDINKFQKKYKAITDENKVLSDKISHWERDKAADIATAEQVAIAPHRAEVSRLRVELTRMARQLEDSNERYRALAIVRENLHTANDSALRQIADLTADRDTWRNKHDEQLPTVLLAEEKVRDLMVEFKRLEDKISRKDQERINAIENRKALAGVAPTINRR